MTTAVSALALLPLMFLFSPCRPPPYVESFSFIFFLLFFHSRPAAAQPVTPKKEHYLLFGFNPSMIITIVLLIAALIFLAFFFIYIRNCHGLNSNRIAVRRVNDEFRRHRYKMRSLNASVIETFPTMVYSEVKAHKIGKVALECAVCLNEFEDDDKLRLIPKCDHIFHPECIDVWLACHTTCPVCRADLDSQPSEHLSQPSESDNTVTELHNEA